MTTGETEHRGHDEWFADWFGDEYLELYDHRDQSEAQRVVELVAAHARVPAGAPVLDLACGAGRHLVHLRAAGLNAFGVDLSWDLLRHARAAGLPVARGDMREIPVRTGSLAMVTSLFTSFGYFPDPADDERVLAEVRRTLRPGGVFAVDYLNAERVRANLRPRDEEEVSGRRVVQTRALVEGGSVVAKRIEIYDAPHAPPRVFHERVRLYGARELSELLAGHGIETEAAFGDYAGGPLSPTAPRVILIGRSR